MFEKKVAEAPLFCVAPPVVTALASVVLFFFPAIFLNFVRMMF
jgi:hypothetical protein